MIVVSGVLVLVALVFLVIGLIGEGLTFIWVSIVTSLIAGVFLLLGALQRRGAPAPAADGATTGPTTMENVTAVSVRPREEAPAPADAGDDDTAGWDEVPASAAAASPEVSVVPGRPRYHVAGCRFLTGRPDVQTVPVDQARSDGFTACGVCKPDAALERAETALATAPETSDVADDTVSDDLAAETAAFDTVGAADEPAGDTAPVATATRARKAPAKRAAAAKPARATATAEVADDGEPAADEALAAPAKPARAAKPAAKKAAAAVGAAGAAGGQVVVIPDRGKFHTEMCRFVKDVPGTVNLSKPAAKRQGYTPCGVCKP